MDKQAVASIAKHFEGLPDPRSGNAKAHIFLEILIIAICAVICGADGWSDIELFGKKKKAWLQTFLELPKGIPSHDTFGRVFAKLKPEKFGKAMLNKAAADRLRYAPRLRPHDVTAALPTQPWRHRVLPW